MSVLEFPPFEQPTTEVVPRDTLLRSSRSSRLNRRTNQVSAASRSLVRRVGSRTAVIIQSLAVAGERGNRGVWGTRFLSSVSIRTWR